MVEVHRGVVLSVELREEVSHLVSDIPRDGRIALANLFDKGRATQYEGEDVLQVRAVERIRAAAVPDRWSHR